MLFYLNLAKNCDNVYALHICSNAQNRVGLGSGCISMSLKTRDEFINHICARVNVGNYAVIRIFRSPGLFLASGHMIYTDPSPERNAFLNIIKDMWLEEILFRFINALFSNIISCIRKIRQGLRQLTIFYAR